jgi:Fur family iron response transcriptional regulator
MLFAKAKSAKISMSLATVYNTLHRFTDAGLLRKVNTDGSRLYFDTNSTPHHHFVTKAGELFDIPESSISVRCLQEVPIGTEIIGVDVIVRLRKVDLAARSDG